MHPTTQIAKNHILISRSLFHEAMRVSESKAYKKSVQKIALILIALYLAVAAWLWHTGGSLFFLLGESIFLGALLFWLMVMLPNTRRNSEYKAMAQGSDSLPERTVVFYRDRLSVTSNTGKITWIPYSDVAGWLETKNLYLLNCRNNISVLLDKKGFIDGDFKTVKSFVFDDPGISDCID